MQKVRISAVSYLNTKPFIYGMFRGEMAELIDLSLDIPAVCAGKLASGAVDLALTPVAIIPELPQAYLVSDYCIGAVGPVRTVCIFSQRPLESIRKIYLDFHSRSSVALTQLLCREYWHIQPEFLPATPGFEDQIAGDTAGLIIGDRAMGRAEQFRYVYDLGEAWTAWTGLPFVFAAWVSLRPLEEEFLQKFNKALAGGIAHVPELIKILPAVPNFDLNDYFTHNISYDLDDAKWLGLNHFLTYLAGDKGYTLHRNVLAATV